MDIPAPQRVITISIVGDGENAVVYYSYLSPVTGLIYVDSPVCDVLVDRPIHTLYVLDYSASLNGWKLVKTSPHDGSPELPWLLGAKDLSLMTINACKNNDTYSYYIHYVNTVSGAVMKRDPQEANIPRSV
jgi:hypothetical protein